MLRYVTITNLHPHLYNYYTHQCSKSKSSYWMSEQPLSWVELSWVEWGNRLSKRPYECKKAKSRCKQMTQDNQMLIERKRMNVNPKSSTLFFYPKSKQQFPNEFSNKVLLSRSNRSKQQFPIEYSNNILLNESNSL